MRTGQILLGRGRLAEAGRVYEDYLTDFPDGRRWEEASYWVARTRLELGDTIVARRHISRIRREGPVSYYAVMGTALLGEPYDIRVPQGAAPVEVGWLTAGLHRLDRLLEAGLEDGADAEEKRLTARAKGSEALTLRLAEALIERGRTIAGINLGWDLRRAGTPWDRRLLEVVYPFPYREIVSLEAAEWGLDPIMLAALIRQESAFEADIVSHAGAVGLMQVMPTTGEGLARAHGPAPFHEANLTAPEVNLHLGAAFFVDMSARYDGDLPLVLSAYNAGPTRATRWRRYPEASDPLRFTERIPFEETRGYVKNVRRNLGLYQLLYGQP
jgi:soluble lytic murein transglycosylase